ncbi:MAG: DUF1049 domain-containing protein, partial [Actinomycetota bacterium]|nr:DUF1049 domain-containing protein [Actinomycetota bacterium]
MTLRRRGKTGGPEGKDLAGRSFRQLTALVLFVVMLVFITQNRRSTTVRFLIPETTAPLWVALFVSALLG